MEEQKGEKMRRIIRKNRRFLSSVVLLLFVVNFACTGIYADQGAAVLDHDNPAPEGYHYVCEETDGHYDHDQLTCTQEEHSHSDGCKSSEVTCGESEGGPVTEDVTNEDGTTSTVTVSEGHSHSDSCYSSELTCGQEEHSHSDSCYAFVEGTHTCRLVKDGEVVEPPVLDDPELDEGFSQDTATSDGGITSGGAADLVDGLPVIEEGLEIDAQDTDAIVNQKVSLYDAKDEELIGAAINPADVSKFRFDFTTLFKGAPGQELKRPLRTGDKYEIDLSGFALAFDITDQTGFEIEIEGSKAILGTVTVSGEDGKKAATITFSDYVENHEDAIQAQAYFWLSAKLKKENIENIDWSKVSIPFMGGVVIDWGKPDTWNPSIDKTGTFSKEDQTITWTIQVGKEGLDLSGAVITDKLPEHVTFVGGSAKLGTKSIADENIYVDEERTISYTFDQGVKGLQTLEFKTFVDVSAIKAKSATVITNMAKLSRDGKDVSDSTSVTIPTTLISKEGKFLTNNSGQIGWTITVNKEQFPLGNMVVTDTLTTGLTVSTGSITLQQNTGPLIHLQEKAAGSTAFPYYTLDGQTLKVFINGDTASSDTWKIYLTTDVGGDSGYFHDKGIKIDNEAELAYTLKGVGGQGETYGQSATATVGYSLINKYQWKSYNIQTHNFKWFVDVNSNGLSLKNAVMTDDFKESVRNNSQADAVNPWMNLVTGTVVSNGITLAEIEGVVGSAECTKSQTQHYHYVEHKLTVCLGDITTKQAVTFETKIRVMKDRNENSVYRNTAKLTYTGCKDGILDWEDTTITNVHFTKASKGYNYETGQNDWELGINQARSALKSPKVTDTIPAGFAYTGYILKDSDGKVIGSSDADGSRGDTITNIEQSIDEISKKQVVTFSFKDFEEGKDAYTLLIKTKLTEDGAKLLFGNKDQYNKAVEVQNTAVLTGDDDFRLTVSALEKIKNNVLSKDGEQLLLPNGGYSNQLKWDIEINQNGGLSTLSGAAIVDQLPPGLELAKDGDGNYMVSVWNMERTSTGAISKSSPLSAEEVKKFVKLDETLKKLTFTLPDNTKAYCLELITLVDKSFNGDISNKAFVEGFEQEITTIEKEIPVHKYGGGASVVKGGNISITKVAAENKQLLLSGAKFDLYYKETLLDTQITGTDGLAWFKGLYPATYTIKESKAPDGYALPNQSWEVTVTGESDSTNNIVMTIENSVTPPDPTTPTDPTPGNPGGGGGGNRPTPPDIIVNPDQVPGGGIKPEEDVDLGEEPIPGGGITTDTTIVPDEAVPGGQLPKTGGVPAGLFYGIGAALLFGAGMLRKMEKKNR